MSKCPECRLPGRWCRLCYGSTFVPAWRFCECGGIIEGLHRGSFPVLLSMCFKCQKEHGPYHLLQQKGLAAMAEIKTGPYIPERTEPRVPEQDDTESSRRRLDPELRVMGLLLREIEELDDPARARVVAWLNSRYQGVK